VREHETGKKKGFRSIENREVVGGKATSPYMQSKSYVKEKSVILLHLDFLFSNELSI